MTTPDPEATARIDSDARFTPRPRGADAQFAPGTIIAGRYRISSILGSGGMGEVYRADDIKLDQTVALKFLPARLARDPILLARLHDEVRLGRVITHPNVCRLYDIVEWDDAQFVAMEYVDGEDLSRLLRRIGRLAHDKAVDIARGIAAGLQAAHAKGILHRDLKPANVMIDSSGDARIMDFGLALAAGEDDGTISGTPAYMAPEQLSGEPATVQSDLYALGLVMYELFTGRRAHHARSMQERMRDIAGEVATPSSVIRDIDAAVERIILRCLANDPSQRPRSAREVIAALPGGDPLAAALAAGETPSPRVVAAAGAEGSLKPWVAWTLLAGVFLFVFIAMQGKRLFSVSRYVPLDSPPEVLREHAMTKLRALGVPAHPYKTHWFEVQESYFGWLYHDPSPRRWERLRAGPPLVSFTYVESAQPRRAEVPLELLPRPGTTAAGIDVRGRLVSLKVMPLREWPARPLDWKPLLRAAGLDAAKLTPATPRLVPQSPADARAAWSGRHPGDGTPIHVEAAAWHGTPVFFALSGPWENSSLETVPFGTSSLAVFVTALVLAAIAVGLLLAWRNARLRRGDRAGALKVATLMFAVTAAAELLRADHQPAGLHEVAVLQQSMQTALLWGAVVYVLYLALEPFVRRRCPQLLIASGRLLAGNPRDPMVGRDALIGILIGVAHPAAIMTGTWIEQRAGHPYLLFAGTIRSLAGTRHALADIADAIAGGALQGFILVILLVMLMLVLRKRVLAAVGLFGVAMLGFYFATGGIGVVTTLLAAMLAFVTARFGLLAVSAGQVAFHTVFHNNLFTTMSWSSIQLLPVLFVLAGALWAFRTSLGGQSPFSASLIDE